MSDLQKLNLIINMAKMFMLRRRRRQKKLCNYYQLCMGNQLLFLQSMWLAKQPKPKICWSKCRNAGWWYSVVLETFTETDWIKNFRVDKSTFNEICDMVRVDLAPKPNPLNPRLPISVEKQVAVALYKFASCAEMRVIGNNMGISTCSVHKCIRRFTNAMLKHATKIICMPTEEEARAISKKFFSISKIPQVLLVIDGTHVPVLAPKDGHSDFINRKGWTSYNVQIVADVNYIIRDVSCGFPGSSHDAYIFKNSGLFESGENIMPTNPKIINNTKIDYFIIGDPAYPLMKWLIKGYSGNLTEQEESFNAYLNSARIVIEQTIGKLKSRWRILKKFNEMDYTFVPKIVVVCCMLHNIVQKKKQIFPIASVEESETVTELQQPEMRDMSRLIFPQRQQYDAIRQQGEEVRHALRLVTDQLPLRKQIIIQRN